MSDSGTNGNGTLDLVRWLKSIGPVVIIGGIGIAAVALYKTDQNTTKLEKQDVVNTKDVEIQHDLDKRVRLVEVAVGNMKESAAEQKEALKEQSKAFDNLRRSIERATRRGSDER